MKPWAVVAAIWCIPAAAASGQTVYNATPDWTSTDVANRGTGAALVDLDLDGWLDFVVANGNDMNEQRLAVYYNQGDGTFFTTPDWQSSDDIYNGHLSVADVNADGWPDVAVATLGGSSSTGPIARVYMNNSGTLSALPDWSADVVGHGFGVAFGDVNNDGRPDLAVATGWPYGSGVPDHEPRVYLNVNGQLEATAAWVSASTTLGMNVLWTDADDDGWLDLVVLAGNTETHLYRNPGGTLEANPSWTTAEGNNHFTLMGTAGDADGDALRDLFVADNNQLFGGSGLFKQYDGLAGGGFSTTPTWSCWDGSPSAIALADVDADGKLDLATGGWWRPARLFLNNGTGFTAAPQWSSSTASVIEKIVFADVDNNALRRDVETFTPAPGRRLYYLSRQPIEQVLSVQSDGVELDADQYTVGHEHGWITVAVTPTATLEVDYLFSHSLDLAISNWDSTAGNYLYYNQFLVNGNCDGDADVDLEDYACFHACMQGPGVAVDADDCGAFDADLDRDVDLTDLPAFVTAFGM